MTAWAHRYSEPLLWLACAAVVVALSCVPRCARAGNPCATCTATSSTTEATWGPPDVGVAEMVVPADHVHPFTPGCLCPVPLEGIALWKIFLACFFATMGFSGLNGLIERLLRLKP